MKVKSESEVAQSCLTLRNPMGCSLPGSSVHGIFQARLLEWGNQKIKSTIIDLYLIISLITLNTNGTEHNNEMTKILKKNLIYLLIGLLLISGLFILTKNNGIIKANADSIDWNCYDGEDLPDKYENKIKSIQNNKGDVSYLKDNDKSNGREPTNLYFNETVGVSYNTLSYNEVTYTLNTQWNGREDKEGLRRYTFYLFSYNGEKLTPLEVVIVECIKGSYYKTSGNWWTGYYTTQYRNLDINESHIFEHLGISNFFAIINNVIMMNLCKIFLPLQYDCKVKEKLTYKFPRL